jgi:multiple sugar transport system permease protein
MMRRRRRWPGRVALCLGLLLLIVVTVFPVFYMLLTSLKPNSLLLAQPPVFWFRPILDNYVTLLAEGDFARYWRNSLVVAVGATLLAVWLGAMVAFAFAHMPFRARRSAFFLVLLPRTFPPVTTIIPIFFVVRVLGMMDQVTTLILFETAARLPLVIWILRGFMRSVPVPLIEAAMLDGATMIQAFFRIAVPLAAPGLAAVALIAFIDTWNAFLVPLVLTNFNAVTAPVGMLSYITSDEQVVWGIVAAGAMLTIAPTLLLAFTLNRFLLRGLTAGAIK